MFGYFAGAAAKSGRRSIVVFWRISIFIPAGIPGGGACPGLALKVMVMLMLLLLLRDSTAPNAVLKTIVPVPFTVPAIVMPIGIP